MLAEIQQIDGSMEHAVEAYDAATAKLNATRRALRLNTLALRVARSNLTRSQATLAQRMVSLYATGDEQSTLSVMLGSSSLDDMINRLETVQRVTQQDSEVIGQVTSFKREVQTRQGRLERARVEQARAVAARVAERARIERQLSERKALLSTIRGQIAHIQAAEHARQLQLAAQARVRVETQPPVDSGGAVVGISAATPEASVAPPSQYGGVAAIAMSYLGVPYAWGGSSPSGFDCSGLVAYVYAQVGVSLPHYTGAQWNVGVPVSRGDLQPGDLVFFNGLGHVGIYIGGGQFVHAPHTGDVVKISSLSESWYASTYDGARRVTG
ncbi:MAG: NlpC/P60 family protein [Gaiellaceae bacterium]